MSHHGMLDDAGGLTIRAHLDRVRQLSREADVLEAAIKDIEQVLREKRNALGEVNKLLEKELSTDRVGSARQKEKRAFVKCTVCHNPECQEENGKH